MVQLTWILDALFFIQMKARKDVTAMISRSKEGHESANSDLREEERVMKEQSEIHGNPSTPP